MQISSVRRRRRRKSSSYGPGAGREDNTYQLLLDSLDVGVARVSLNGDLLYANARFSELIGADPRHVGGCTNLSEFIAPASWPMFDKGLRQAQGVLSEGEMTIEGIGVPARILRISLSPLLFPDGTSIGIVALDITEHRRIQKDLEESKRSLEQLSGRILRLQDEERRRIARDLHDVIGQEVAVVSVTLNRLNKELGSSPPKMNETIGEATSLLTKIQEEVRTLSYLLHPPMLDELGIVSALGMYVEGFEKRSGIQVSFEAGEDFPRLGDEQEIALFRVVQEGLTNVLRHSGSKSAEVRLSATPDRVAVMVRDKGIGIPHKVLRNLLEKNVQVGVGIPGLNERLKQLGGLLEIRSNLPGTEILARLPLAEVVPQTLTEAERREPYPRSGGARKRVLIADDHEVTRQGIRALLSTQPDIDVCGEAADGLDAVKLTQQLGPDLVFLDSAMPRAGGLYAAHIIRDAGMRCKILIFAEHFFPQFEATVRKIGCNGYLLKSHLATDLLRAVRGVLAGEEFFPGPSGTVPARENATTRADAKTSNGSEPKRVVRMRGTS